MIFLKTVLHALRTILWALNFVWSSHTNVTSVRFSVFRIMCSISLRWSEYVCQFKLYFSWDIFIKCSVRNNRWLINGVSKAFWNKPKRKFNYRCLFWHWTLLYSRRKNFIDRNDVYCNLGPKSKPPKPTLQFLNCWVQTHSL